ncbi:MAG: hypothetical protein EBY16_06515 [Gammaproteobacteria bacterium]|nr:hypothetical protein [Gammaproteobacteria bacterium]
MEKRTKLRLGLLLSTFVCIPSAQAILSSTNTAAVGTTSANITLSAIDQATGDFYVATGAPGGAGVGTLGALCNIGKFSIPTTNIAAGTTLTGTNFHNSEATGAEVISAMALSRSGTTTRVVYNLSTGVAAAGSFIQRIKVTDGTTLGEMAAQVQTAAPANGLVAGLAASPISVFAAIGTGAGWVAGDANGVISSYLIPATNILPAAAATAGVYTAGLTVGVTAAVNVLGFSIATAITATPGNSPKMIYDPVFANLYIGQSVTTAANAADGGRSLLIMNVNTTTGSLTPVAIKTNPAATWTDFQGGAAGNMIGDIHANAVATNLAVSNLGIMHTSTGMHYLILNGGNGLAAVNGNQVWALPLVSPGYTGAGTLADVTSVGFSVQANLAASLYTTASIPAIVGNAVLPWQVSTIPTCMQVVGDTVYISNGVDAGGTDESGIMYSQAIFGAEGKIVRWTRWEKAAPAAMGTYNNAVAAATDGSINLFGVDARSGRIWSVPEQTGQNGANVLGARMVKLSNWADTLALPADTANGTLAAALALPANLPEGVWSVYNVGRSSVNFGAATTAAYTVFGGQGKVAFARTDIKAASVLAYQVTPPTDFTLAANLLTTTLPAGAGVVQCLGYSHWAVGAADGYFFAGTNAGLYAYSLAAGGGFTPNLPLAGLNAAPWSTAGNLWTQIANVTGAVRKIRSIGNKVYILARDNNAGVITDTLYGVSVRVTVALINANIETLAVSGTGNLANATVINDFEIVSWTSGSPTATAAVGGDLEQVILATNDGLYQSQALLGLNAAANTTQTLALWTQVDQDAAFTLLHSQNRLEAPTSFVGSYIADNSDGKGTFTKSLVNQFIAQGPSVTSNPIDFTDNVITDIFPSIVTSYWSDGARRFISTAPGDGTLNLQTLPYKVDSANFNMTAPLLGLDRVNGKNVHAIAMMPNGYVVACLGPDGIAVL